MSYTPTEWQTGDIVTADKLNKLETGVEDMNMSYTPTEWANGDIVTAEKLNKLENGVAAGGGGSSDFTTAEVTVINHATYTVYVAIPTEYEENTLYDGSPAALSADTFFDDGDTVTINVPLYKGSCYVSGEPFASLSVDVEGDIQQLQYGNLLITGDGTITISPAQ